MKIKKSDVVKLHGAFESLLKIRMKADTAFAIASNCVSLEKEASVIKKAYQPIEGFTEYQKERNAIISKYKGSPVPGGGVSFEPGTAGKVMADIKALEEKNRELLIRQSEYDVEFDKALDQEVDVDLVKIKREDISADVEPSLFVELIKAGMFVPMNYPAA